MSKSENIIYDFKTKSDISDWIVVDDVVMGGRSFGKIKLSENNSLIYFGDISLENNGGFSSLRHRFVKKDVSKFSKVKIRLKGDGKNYQFRIKINLNDYHSYISSFKTTTNWQTIEINMSNMYPAFRGRNLDMPNLSTNTIEEIAFLIGNKKKEHFSLEIDKIYLE